MLAVARMIHLTKASTVVTNSNSSTVNDDHVSLMTNSTEKLFLLNGGIPPEPTTPCILNTPNTCTKNSTFYYEIPSTMHAPTLSGKNCFSHSVLMLFV